MAVLSLDEVKDALGIETTQDDAKLTRLMPRAEAWVSSRCGPLEPTAVTSRLTGGRCSLVLPKGPAISVQTLTGRYAGVVSSTLYTMSRGIIRADAEFTDDWYDVAYTIGRPVGELPDDLHEAALHIARHLWRPNQGPVGPRQGDQTAEAMKALRLAQELIAPYRRRQVST